MSTILATRYVKVGDVGIPFEATLYGSDGVTPVNLSGATVRFIMTERGATDETVDAAATVVSPTAGTVRYTSLAADLDTAGAYLVEWRVAFGGGGVQRYPGDGYNQVVVKANLGGPA